jgi:peptidoglycan/LPS O-acetylase OafA/YrhL
MDKPFDVMVYPGAKTRLARHMTVDILTLRSNDSSTIIGGLAAEPNMFAAKTRPVRNDIEGLRALAVLAVIVNHAFPKALPGGFAGVDIFFVISGYLIGRHLLEDIQAGHLSILGFYAKRARRIFPALALVLISVWGAGWMFLSATEFSVLGQHIVASAFFSNNILLWSESGYFDVAALDKPLLHLWSLGIEEQFYLLVPALLWFGSKDSAGSVRWVAGLGALSLLAMICLSPFDFAGSFYLLHARFWELAAGVVLAKFELRVHAHGRSADGVNARPPNIREVLIFSSMIALFSSAVLGSNGQRWGWDTAVRDSGLILVIIAAVLAALYVQQDGLRRRLVKNASYFAKANSLAGIILICASVGVLNSANWPGPQTLFPVLGTVMLIAATPTRNANKVLSTWPLAFIGGISYPLYLWHWPVIVFWRLLNPAARGIQMLVPLSIAFVLAWLTKALIEDPVRFGRLGWVSFHRPHLRLAVVGLVFAAALGSLTFAMEGLPSRIPPRLQAIAEWSENNSGVNWREGRCFYTLRATADFASECTPTKRPGVPLVLLWGDSHAAHLYPGLVRIQSMRSFDIVQWTAGSCPPSAIPFAYESVTCPMRRATALKELKNLKPDTILVAGAWELYLGTRQSEAAIVHSLSETIRELRKDGDKEIVVFGPGMTWHNTLAIDLYRFMIANRLNEIPERLELPSEAVLHLDVAMAALADALNVHYVSTLSYFCNKSGCRTMADRTKKPPDLLFSDSNHLTVSGSEDLIAHSELYLF